MRALLFAVYLCWVLGGYAQSNDFQKYREQRRKEFSDYRDRRRSEFEEFRRKRNKEFADYLAARWNEIEVYKGITPPTIPQPFVPKPDEKKDEAKPVVPHEFPIEKVTPPPPIVIPVKPPKIDVPITPIEDKHLDVLFCGAHYKVRAIEQSNINIASVTPANIAAAWQQLAVEKSDPLVYDCQQIREQFKLCDYIYYLFIKQVGISIYGTRKPNEVVLLTGYILAQSGIDFRYALHGQNLKLALAFNAPVYGVNFYRLNNRNYYLMDCEHVNHVHMVRDAYAQDAQPCRLAFTESMRLPVINNEERILTSKKYPTLRMNVTTNLALMEAYGKYPKTDWAIYANTPIDEVMFQQIFSTFHKVIANRNEEESVNMILNFVQTAFVYGYDNEIWGHDRSFFPDETIFYPYSDCEDRAILFSQLILKLTDLDVVLLHYPNHLATGIRFSRDLPGDYVMIDGYKYLVCDPTGYKPIGNAYEQFKHVKAKVIKLK